MPSNRNKNARKKALKLVLLAGELLGDLSLGVVSSEPINDVKERPELVIVKGGDAREDAGEE